MLWDVIPEVNFVQLLFQKRNPEGDECQMQAAIKRHPNCFEQITKPLRCLLNTVTQAPN